jgi:hypothetical protein
MRPNSYTDREVLEELNREMVKREEEAAGADDQAVASIRRFFEIHLSKELVFRRADGTIVTAQMFLDGLKGGAKRNREARLIEVSFSESHSGNAVVTLLVFTQDTDGRHCYRNIRHFKLIDELWKMYYWYNYDLTPS